MKWYIKLINAFLFCLLTGLIVTLVLSVNLKNIIVDGIVMETITEKLSNKEYQEGSFNLDGEIDNFIQEEKVREILKNPEVKDLIQKYLEITLHAITDESDLSEVELEKDILNYLDDNKEVLEEVVGQEITEEVINQTEEQLQSKEMSRVFKQNIQNTKKSLTSKEVTVVKGYELLTKKSFHWTVLGLILLTLIGIALLQKSFYKWIKTLGSSMTLSGISILIMSISVSKIVSSASDMKNFKIHVLLRYGTILLLIGLIVVGIYSLIEKTRKKKNEIS